MAVSLPYLAEIIKKNLGNSEICFGQSRHREIWDIAIFEFKMRFERISHIAKRLFIFS